MALIAGITHNSALSRLDGSRAPYIGMNHDDNTTHRKTSTRSFLSRYRAELLCALMLALMAANFLSVIRRKSITIDETLMIPAGYYHLTARDFRPINEHPPFAKVLGALPLVLAGAQAQAIDPAPGHDYEYYVNLCNQFWRSNHERYESLSFRARVPLIGVTLLLGVLVFIYARRLFGERAALLAVALFALEPTVLAHGRVVQTDIPSAFAYLLFCFTLYEHIRAPSLRRAVYVGLAAGLAVVTKFSMIVLWPVLAVTFYVLWVLARKRGQSRSRVWGHALVVAVASVVVVNAAYLFVHSPGAYQLSPASVDYATWLDGVLRVPIYLLSLALQTIFPPDFIYGISS
ncbi:MAG: glycosyltransferase family 39 protein [Acidobacteria bacterium]|nr:glycosyltransferase family 39 protein [Acidobacteriota bacterium]